MSRTNESTGKGHFDIYIGDVLFHDSSKNGIPGPRVVENLIQTLKTKLKENS